MRTDISGSPQEGPGGRDERSRLRRSLVEPPKRYNSRYKDMLTAVVLLLAALGAGRAAASPLTALERQRLIAHMEMTESWLVEEVSELSPAQPQFRPAPGIWSILEVLDHLVVAEPIYWQDLRKAMQASPANRRPSSTDVEILWYGIDRTHHQKAIAAEEPKERLRDMRAGLDTLRRLHAEMRRYAGTTDDDLRSHVVEREGCDAYQWLLLISAHEQRHVLQIREIKADAKFPAELVHPGARHR